MFTLVDLLGELLENCMHGNGSFHNQIGQDAVCDPTTRSDRYRRSDGVCNNLDNKHWGATGIAMRRMVSTAYECNKRKSM